MYQNLLKKKLYAPYKKKTDYPFVRQIFKNLSNGLIESSLFRIKPEYPSNDNSGQTKVEFVRGTLAKNPISPVETTTWILTPNGEFHMGLTSHVDYCMNQWGYGLPVACAGDIQMQPVQFIHDNNSNEIYLKKQENYFKMIYLDNRSGHW